MPTWLKWVIGIFAVLLVLGALAPSEDKSSDDSASDNTSQSEEATTPAETPAPAEPAEEKPKPAAKPEPVDCGNKATDECTPRVNLGGSVRVDAIVWKVKSVSTASELGDPDLFGEKADGRFVVVTLSAHSEKNESATLTNNAFQLEIGGNKYDTDSDGTIAAVGAGEEPFFLEDIGPDSDVTGKVVFDVPAKVLSKKVEMRFNELGFGSTHGYIDISSQL